MINNYMYWLIPNNFQLYQIIYLFLIVSSYKLEEKYKKIWILILRQS